MTNPDAARARDLLAESEPAMRGRSDRMLAAAQVHATLAVEAAVRELIAQPAEVERLREVIARAQHQHCGCIYVTADA
jgi:hypothetical protein